MMNDDTFCRRVIGRVCVCVMISDATSGRWVFPDSGGGGSY
jgi:hypothetical protein